MEHLHNSKFSPTFTKNVSPNARISFAYSKRSAHGSAPEVTMKSTGVSGLVSSLWMRSRLLGCGITDVRPSTSHTKRSIALCSRSGRSVCTVSMRWNGDSFCACPMGRVRAHRQTTGRTEGERGTLTRVGIALTWIDED